MDTFEGVQTKHDLILIAVYKLIHRDTGKFYIGSTKDFHTRKRKHIDKLRKGIHYSKELQELYNESPHFIFELDSIGTNQLDPQVRERAYDREQSLIDEYWNNPLLLNKSRKVRYPDIVRTEESELNRINKVREAHQRPEVLERRIKALSAARRSSKARQQQSAISQTLWQNSEYRTRMEAVWKDPNYLQKQVENQPTSKKVIAAGQEFGSVSQASVKLGMSRNTIKQRIKDPTYIDYYFT